MSAIRRKYKKIDDPTLYAWRQELTSWMPSEPFRIRVQEIFATPNLGQALFRQGGLQFLRDAWVAARVATALTAQQVRLCPPERPDFELDLDGALRQFEVTEADMPGRRRGDESFEPGKVFEDSAES